MHALPGSIADWGDKHRKCGWFDREDEQIIKWDVVIQESSMGLDDGCNETDERVATKNSMNGRALHSMFLEYVDQKYPIELPVQKRNSKKAVGGTIKTLSKKLVSRAKNQIHFSCPSKPMSADTKKDCFWRVRNDIEKEIAFEYH